MSLIFASGKDFTFTLNFRDIQVSSTKLSIEVLVTRHISGEKTFDAIDFIVPQLSTILILLLGILL